MEGEEVGLQSSYFSMGGIWESLDLRKGLVLRRLMLWEGWQDEARFLRTVDCAGPMHSTLSCHSISCVVMQLIGANWWRLYPETSAGLCIHIICRRGTIHRFRGFEMLWNNISGKKGMRGITNQEILEFSGSLGNPEEIETTNIVNVTEDFMFLWEVTLTDKCSWQRHEVWMMTDRVCLARARSHSEHLKPNTEGMTLDRAEVQGSKS